MNSMMISEETLAEKLADCADGETGEFKVQGTLHRLPTGGAVVTFDEISKSGYKNGKLGKVSVEKDAGMSPEATAIVARPPRRAGAEDYPMA